MHQFGVCILGEFFRNRELTFNILDHKACLANLRVPNHSDLYGHSKLRRESQVNESHAKAMSTAEAREAYLDHDAESPG